MVKIKQFAEQLEIGMHPEKMIHASDLSFEYSTITTIIKGVPKL